MPVVAQEPERWTLIGCGRPGRTSGRQRLTVRPIPATVSCRDCHQGPCEMMAPCSLLAGALPVAPLLSTEPSSQRLCSQATPLENLVCGGRNDGFLAGAPQFYQLVLPEIKQARARTVKPALHTGQSVEFPIWDPGKSVPLIQGAGHVVQRRGSELPNYHLLLITGSCKMFIWLRTRLQSSHRSLCF